MTQLDIAILEDGGECHEVRENRGTPEAEKGKKINLESQKECSPTDLQKCNTHVYIYILF